MKKKLTPKARIEKDSDGYYSVDIIWPRVDRPNTYSISTGKNAKLATRLAAAIDAGAATTFNAIEKDSDGETYVNAEIHVMGRMLNADLKRLGY